MEKFELKHLAPYLPYGLKVLWAHRKGNIKKQTYFTLADASWLMSKPVFKPILRPLSDLTIKWYWDNLQNSDYALTEEDVFEIKNTPRGHLKYYQFDYLCKHHFDFFGLIPKNLAIDINTLK